MMQLNEIKKSAIEALGKSSMKGAFDFNQGKLKKVMETNKRFCPNMEGATVKGSGWCEDSEAITQSGEKIFILFLGTAPGFQNGDTETVELNIPQNADSKEIIKHLKK